MFWKDLSSGKYIRVKVVKDFEDLGYCFKPGQELTVEELNCSEFFRHGLNVIPKVYCEKLRAGK